MKIWIDKQGAQSSSVKPADEEQPETDDIIPEDIPS